MKKILSFVIVALFVSVSFGMVSWDAASEEVTGPFAARDVGYPTLITVEDQVQDDATYNTQITSTYWVYQTFRPGVTGNLNRVSFHLTGSTGTGNVHVCLYHTDQVGNLQAQIASTTTDAFTDGWLEVVFTPEPALNKGVEYALKLSTDGTKQVHWHDSGADNYPSGQMYWSMPETTTETRYMRGVSNEVTVNGLMAYSFGTSQSATNWQGATLGNNQPVYAGIRVWKRDVGGTESEITPGSAVGTANRAGGAGAGIVVPGDTWMPPEIALLPTDSIVVRLYQGTTFPPGNEMGIFTTEQLGATKLDAVPWQPYYWIESSGIGSFVGWGSNVQNTRVEGFKYSDDVGKTYTPENIDMTFKTYMEYNVGGVKKVAWHSSGSFALGVTGADHMVHRYDRVSGTWSPFLNMNVGEVMHDVVFDALPGYDRFYFVGQNTNNGEPMAYEFQYDPVGGSNLFPRNLGGINGVFYGVEHSNDGLSNNMFLAVGRNIGANMPMAYWYDKNTGWKQVSSGLVSGDILSDACWDKNSFYYAVGSDGSNKGVVYRFMIGATSAAKISTPTLGSLRAIDWSPASIPEDYAVIVGERGVGPGNAHTFDRTNVVTISTSNDIFNDVDWHPLGDMAVIVGSDNTGTEGAVLLHYPAAGTTVPSTHLLPVGAPPFYGVAVKGPSSPSSAIITGTGGGISFYPSALNQDTQITVNAVVPKLYWIGFNNTAMNSRLDQQVPVDADYFFTLQANYSEGWSNCEVFVQAWHDQGLTNLTGSGYPAITDESTRNLAFTLYWAAGAPAATVGYPNTPELEITTGAVTDNVWWAHPFDADQDHHRVTIPVHFGRQLRSADFGGVAPTGPAYSPDANMALNNPNSWDFNIVIRDLSNPSAFNRSYGEFGIHKTVAVSVTGNPSAAAPPGSTNVPMTTNSQITYSANMPYWLNVSIPHLLKDGVGPLSIGADNVSVQNIHPTADAANSYISGGARYFDGASGVAMNVWGLNASALQPAGNGTFSAGPWVTDYNSVSSGYNAFTEMQWWVSVQAAVQEGVYIAIITFTIDS